MTFDSKLVAIINKKVDAGIAMNALAHMAIGLGAQLDNTILKLNNYQDKDLNIYPNISQMPFIILKGKSGEIRKSIQKAKQENIQYSIFTDTMTGGTYQQQLDKTLETTEEELTYYGAIFFGSWNIVSEITKKFSLYI